MLKMSNFTVIFKLFIFRFREYGVAVAEITGAHNLFIDCREAENASLKAMAKEFSIETEDLHTNYTKINVYQLH